MNLEGCELKKLREDAELVLYRAYPPNSGDSLLVLSPASAHPDAATLVRLEHEHGLASELDPAWAAKPLALERYGGRTVLVLTDPGGQPLNDILRQPLELEPFLHLATSIVAALDRVHARGLVHKDIKPANLLVDAAGHVRLTGFGLATRLPRQRQVPTPPEVIAGTLAYMAPEQTGRMNRSIDTRSDLYSLGVTFYELLTGTVPFAASDALEWIHCHVARLPQPPSQRARGIPPLVEAIVLKLLAKTGEDRYQTAAGLGHDLQHCLAQWQAHGWIAPFPLGAHDVSDRLLIPEKLYGRETEVAALRAAFERVTTSGATELVLVSGYSGIGKSALVSELHKALVPLRGFFAGGKFDQYKRDVPYAALAQALQGPIRELLSAPDPELAHWRAALQEGLGANAQLIVNLIPELALIIGEPLPAPDIAPQHQQNRFQFLIQRFIGVFARPEHPLVLFLDDLQWLDRASLELVERLVCDPEVRHLLLIGAYRNNEVGPDHPLGAVLERIRGSGTGVQEIVLSALTVDNIGQMLANALHTSLQRVQPIADLVFEKTEGNPFFAIQFITALDDEGLLSFDPIARAWHWDMERVEAKGITANVVDLMAGRLNRFAPLTLEVLQYLGCLGTSAHAVTLGLLAGLLEEEIHVALWDVVRAGLLLRQGDIYCFTHDRVQEAAYTLVPEAERAGAHLTIGRVLAAGSAPAELQANIFDIASQLNRGTTLITNQDERDKVAEINLIAGRRAKTSTAYNAALSYLRAGRALLEDHSWERQHPLTFGLELNLAECEFLTGDLTTSEKRLTTLMDCTADTIELASVARIGAALFTSIGQTDRAIEVGLNYLHRIGIGWSSHPGEEDFRQEYDEMWRRIGERPIEALIDLPMMSDPDQLAVMGVLATIQQPAFFRDQNLFALVVCRMTNLSLAHGNCDASAFAYTLLVLVLGPRFGRYRAGLRFGRLGFDLVEKRGFTLFRGRVYSVFASVVMPWTTSLRDRSNLYQRAVEVAIEAGDPLYAIHSSDRKVANLLASGGPLAELQREAQSCVAIAEKASSSIHLVIIQIQLGFVLSLRGLTPNLGSFNCNAFDEDAFERGEASDSPLSYRAWQYWIYKLQAHVLAGNTSSAMHAAGKAQEAIAAIPVVFEAAEYRFYAALALAASCTTSTSDARSEALVTLHGHHRQLVLWAKDCPQNFCDRVALVSAEIARLEHRHDDAQHLYEEAIQAAQEQGFVHNQALAYELAAMFHYACGSKTAGDSNLMNARSCYRRWGADGKVRQLSETYPHLRDQTAASQSESAIGLPLEHLDLATIIKVSQAISGEIDLKRLIHTLMRIVLEQSGGDRAVLILPHGNSLWVEAEATAVRDTVEVNLRRTSVTFTDVPGSVLRYVLRTRDSVVLDDVAEQGPHSEDAYIVGRRCHSLVCLPLIKRSALAGVIYIESTSSSHVFTPARTEVLMLIASQAAISLENARLYADLQRLKANLEEAQRLTHTGSFTFDSSTQSLFWSDEIYRIYELDPANGITLEQVVPRVVPEDRHLLQAFIESVPPNGEPHSFEHRIFVLDGSVKTLRIIAHSELNEAGNVILVGTAMDVTERKRMDAGLQSSLQEKDALLKEVHHRVKNNLQLISSMLNLQASRSKESAEAERFAESRNRVRSMALVHENLYRTGDFANVSMVSHIKALCTQLVRAYRMSDQSVDVVTEIDSIELDLDQAVSVGLIINELVSNALKHAFPNGQAGLVQVSLKRSEGDRCILSVRDTGTGLPPGFDVGRAETLGLQLVHDLTQQLRGTITIKTEVGAAFIVVFDANVQQGPRS
jgi:predicted ATPase/two-component sensor histidine kinase/GAF domain-containing protein